MKWLTRAILGSVLLVLFSYWANVRADDTPPSIRFEPFLRDNLSKSVSVPTPAGYDKAVIANTPLPTKTVWVRLQNDESASDVTVLPNGVASIGAKWMVVDSTPVATSSDFPYDKLVVPAEQDSRIGRSAA